MNKFEKLIEYIINDEDQKARELFHEIVVEKSRDIYESIMDEENMDGAVAGNQVEDLTQEIHGDESHAMEDDEEGNVEFDLDHEGGEGEVGVDRGPHRRDPRPPAPRRHRRRGPSGRGPHQVHQRRRRRWRDPRRGAENRHRHLSRHRRRAGRCVGRGGAALHRRANADAARDRHR
mgnify:CR=1 FL=1